MVGQYIEVVVALVSNSLGVDSYATPQFRDLKTVAPTGEFFCGDLSAIACGMFAWSDVSRKLRVDQTCLDSFENIADVDALLETERPLTLPGPNVLLCLLILPFSAFR